MPSLRIFIIILSVAISIPWIANGYPDKTIVVRVGSYDNAPKILQDRNGNIQGIFPDILNEIARREGWKIEYIHGTWEEGLNRLSAGEIDLMPDVAITPNRENQFQFTNEVVLSSWSSLYTKNHRPKIISLFDLSGKRIALLENSIQKAFLEEANLNLPQPFTLIPVNSFAEAFEKVLKGEADVAVANHFAGDWLTRKHPRMIVNELVFNPARLHIAAPLSANSNYLNRIDEHITQMKEDEGSIYYRALNHWGQSRLSKTLQLWQQISLWLILSLLTAVTVLLIFRWQLRQRTKELQTEVEKSAQLNRTLKRSENRIRSAQRLASMGSWEKLLDQNVWIFSPEAKEILGLSEPTHRFPEETFWNLIHPEDLVRVKSKWESFEGTFDLEFRIIHGVSQDTRYLAIRGQKCFCEINGENCLLGFLLDQTKEKTSAANLQRQEELFRIFMDEFPASVFIKDKDLRLLYANRKVCEISGKSLEEIIGKTNAEVFLPEIATLLDANDRSALEGKVIQGESKIPNPKGEVHWVEYRKFPLPDSTGKIESMGGVAIDITANKKAKELLEESKARYEIALKIGQIGTYEWIPSKDEIIWSTETKRIFGLHDSDPAPTLIELESVIHPEFIDVWKSNVQRCVDQGTNHELSFQIKTKQGKWRWVQTIGSMFNPSNGSGARLIGVITDITDRVEQNRSILAAKEAAETANRAKSEFLAVMNHELRTPLNTIIGPADLIASSTEDSEEKEMAQLIRESAHQLLGLINDILDLARIESKSVELKFQSIIIQDFFSQKLKPLKSAAEKKGLQFSLTEIAPLPYSIRMDPDLLIRVLLNVCGNALKFTSQGSIDIQIHWESPNEDPDTLPEFIIQIKDTGPGIPPDLQEKIFEGFQQADMSLNRPHEGTGLGLTISRNLLRMVQGDVHLVQSSPKGSTFEIRFPVQDFQFTKTESPENDLALDEILRSEQLWETLKKKKILVVDDTRMNLSLFEMFLKKFDSKAVYASSGEEAIERSKEKGPFDIVFMDIRLPGIDGITTMEKLRQLHPNHPQFFVAQTSYAETTQRDHFIQCGMDAFLPKPIRFSEFQSVLEKAITINR